MTRRTIGLLVTLALAILVAPLAAAAAAAQPTKVARIGWLSPGGDSFPSMPRTPNTEAFLQG